MTDREKEIRETLGFFVRSRHAIEPCIQSHDPEIHGKYCGCGGCHLWRMFNHAEDILKPEIDLITGQPVYTENG